MKQTLGEWLLDTDETKESPDDGYEIRFKFVGTVALLRTIYERRVQFSPFSRMNDPRERDLWHATQDVRGGPGITDEDVRQRIDDVLRRGTRVFCCTADAPPANESEREFLMHRGWARAAMWDRYAGGHQGACLVIDVAEIKYQLGRQAESDAYRAWGVVDYEDVPLEIPLPRDQYDTSDQLDDDLEHLRDEAPPLSSRGDPASIRTRFFKLYFVKNRGWSTETEYRIVYTDVRPDPADLDQPVYVPLGNALRGVIFGSGYSDPERTAWILSIICAEAGAKAPEFFQCTWDHGRPGLSPIQVSGALPDLASVYWNSGDPG